MRPRNAAILYSIGLAFAIGGFFYRPILIAGWVIFLILALIGVIFHIDETGTYA